MKKTDTRERRYKLASNLKMFEALNKLLKHRPDVKSLIQNSPFSSFLDFSEVSMAQSEFLIEGLVRKWVDVDKKFKFGELGVSVGASEITQILGIKGGDTEVDLSETEESIVWKFLVRSFPDKKEYHCKTLLSHLNEEGTTISAVDFFRFYLAIAFASFLFPTCKKNIENRMLSYLDNVHELNKFDWSGAIHKSLMNALKDGQNDLLEKKTPIFRGCSFFLQIWALEHTQVSISGKKKSGHPLFLKYKNATFAHSVADNILAAKKDVLEFLPEVSPTEGSSSSVAAADLCEPVRATSTNEIEGATDIQQINEVVIKEKGNELESIKSELEEVKQKVNEIDKLIEEKVNQEIYNLVKTNDSVVQKMESALQEKDIKIDTLHQEIYNLVKTNDSVVQKMESALQEKDIKIDTLHQEIYNLVKTNDSVVQRMESALQKMESAMQKIKSLEEAQKKDVEMKKLIAELETLYERSLDPSSDLLTASFFPEQRSSWNETTSSFPEHQSSWNKDLSCSTDVEEREKKGVN